MPRKPPAASRTPTRVPRSVTKLGRVKRPVSRKVQSPPDAHNAIKALLSAEPFAQYPSLRDLFIALPTLTRFVHHRARLVVALAPTLMRVNPKNPKRAQIERQRTKHRKEYREAIRQTEHSLCTILNQILFDPATLLDASTGTWQQRAQQRAKDILA